MGTRTVTGTVYHLDNSPWDDGEVKFTLLEPFETATETYPRETHTETLDVNGEFSITLAVPDTGTAYYKVELPDGNSYKFYLEAGAATTLESLLTIAGSEVDQDAVQTLIDANNVLTITNVTTTHIVQSTEEWIRCNGTFTVTLPVASGSGRGIMIMNIGSGIITVDGNGSDTINGELTQTLDTFISIFVVDAAANKWDAR